MPTSPTTHDHRDFALRLALLYAAIGTAWILASDLLLAGFVESSSEYTWYQHLKGGFFIAATAGLLYLFARRHDRRARAFREDLQERQDFISAVLDTTGALVLVTDRNGAVVSCNRACAAVCGREGEALLGQPVWKVPGETDEQEAMRSAFRDLVDGPTKLLQMETGWTGQDGIRRWVAWSNTALHGPDGTLRNVVFTGVDITRVHETLEALTDSEALYHGLVETANDAILVADAATGHIVSANRRAGELLERPVAEVIGMHQSDLHPADERERYERVFHDHIGQGVISEPMDIRTADGRRIPVEISANTVELSGRTLVQGIFRDISTRLRTEERLRKLSRVAEFSPDAVMITDVDGRIEYCNPRFFEATGYSEAEVIGREPTFLWGEGLADSQAESMWRNLAKGRPWHGEFPIRRKNGGQTWWFSAVGPVPDERGKTSHYVTISQDVGQLRYAERTIERLANYDPVTGLPNRALFRDRLNQALENAIRQNQELAVLIFDIDRFKRINDTLGIEHGDALLEAVTGRLEPCRVPGATLARIGGDEFAAIIPGAEAVTDSARCADHILGSLRPLFHLKEHSLYVTGSLGVATYPADGNTADDLIAYADVALDHAKRLGGDTFAFYRSGLNERSKEHLGLLADLRQGLDQGQITVYYQPLVEPNGGRVRGTEALARWLHPVRGLVPPGDFIPLAEESGLIGILGQTVLEQACAQTRSWQQEGLGDLGVSVNLSVYQLRDDRLAEQVRTVLERSGLAADHLELEVTETDLMHDPEQGIRVLREVAELGVRIAIDDFGTGYSSLNYLKRFPAHTLKVDQSFAQGAPHDEGDAAIARAVIALGHSLGMEVVAEGVETTQIRRFFEDEGCDLLQGYLFGRPLPHEEFSALLTSPPWLQTGSG